jgi:ribosome-associated toxin RatA of RatAB toxin-antitoxin module
VPYTAAQMYAIVNAVEQYPQFVPWCVSSSEIDVAINEKKAMLKFARGALKTSFTTKNILTQNERIEMQLIEGPFKQLEGVWLFTDIDEAGSKVELDLDFEISNRIIRAALEAFFSQICDRMVTAFVQRAKEVYK